MNRIGKHAFVWLLCLALFFALAVPAFAEEAAAQPAAEEAASETAAETAADVPAFEGSILDSGAISKMVDDYLTRKGIGKDRVGIGFCYTATGDEWFLNPDTWFYPGSMYKVPLMMILSERIRDGQVSPDTQIGGLDLDTVYNYVLVHSNNDYAHAVRRFLIDGQGGDEIWRKEAQQYARLDKYDERYMLYCYFSPRYMTQVLETLYSDPDRFPKVMDNLLQAEQGHYFRLLDEMHPYDVAQKYGSYLDNENSNWNHTSGIIYTENPFILTVMTKNVGGAEQMIGEMAALFKDYAQSLDKELAEFRAEQAQLEAERLAAEEAERLAAEQAQAAAQQVPAQTKPQTTPRPGQPETVLQTQTPDRAERGHRALVTMLLILLAAAIIGGIGSVIIVKESERRRYESYKRRFEEEMRQEALERQQAQRREARPAAERPAPSPERARTRQPRTRTQQPGTPQTQPRTRTERSETPPAQRVRRTETPVRQQPRRETPVFDEDQWLHDEEDE